MKVALSGRLWGLGIWYTHSTTQAASTKNAYALVLEDFYQFPEKCIFSAKRLGWEKGGKKYFVLKLINLIWNYILKSR